VLIEQGGALIYQGGVLIEQGGALIYQGRVLIEKGRAGHWFRCAGGAACGALCVGCTMYAALSAVRSPG